MKVVLYSLSVIAVGLIMYTTIYWASNSELTEMQVFLENWYFILIGCVVGLVAILINNRLSGKLKESVIEDITVLINRNGDDTLHFKDTGNEIWVDELEDSYKRLKRIRKFINNQT